MINKRKKYHGGLKVLLLLLFIMLLGSFSTTYAYVSQEYVDYALDNLYENVNTVSTGGYTHANLKNIMAYMKTQNVNLFTRINTMLDTYNISQANDYNCIFLISDGTDYSWVNIVIANNSTPNGIENLGFLRLASETFCSNSTDYIYGIRFVARTTGLSEFSSFQINNTNNKQWNANRNGYSWNQEISVVTFTNLSACGLPAIYSYNPMTNNVIYTSNLYPCILKDSSGNYQLPEPEPEEPSGEIGTGTGTITNPSGEVTGQIDLTGIEQGITDIKDTISGEAQAIRDNDNKNTEQVVNAINNANENYWGSGDDLTGEEQEENIEENLNEMMENLEENLTQSEVIKSLESGEAGFLEFFRNKGENEEAYDLEFQWNKVNYMGATLLESGDINISAMCREIPELGQLQSLIRAIFNFATAIAIIHQIYNLVLSTLGIDNPYLYEDSQEITTVDTGTGEYRQFYKRRRRRL